MEQTINPKNIIISQETRDKWQNIVNILARIMNIPSALIMKVDYPSFVVFNSSSSEENPFKVDQVFTLPAGIYCEKTMKTQQKTLIPNALKDPEWDKNPSISVGLISYLGFPLFYPDKNVFGTLCVLDKKENAYSKDFEDIILLFKEVVESHLNLIWQKAMLERSLAQQKSIEEDLRNKIVEIEKLNKVCIDREIRMVELKNKVDELEKQLH